MLFLYYLYNYGFVAVGSEDYLNMIYFVSFKLFLSDFE
jgi:hypothetical protein